MALARIDAAPGWPETCAQPGAAGGRVSRGRPSAGGTIMATHAILWPFPWWTTPATPDLGAFRQHKHGFEEDGGGFLWCEFAPWEMVNGQPHWIPHQTYIRIRNGEAAFHQRVSAWMVPEGAPPPLFQGLPPAFVLG